MLYVEGTIAGEPAGLLWAGGLVTGHPAAVRAVRALVRDGVVVATLAGVEVVATLDPAAGRARVAATLMAALDHVERAGARPFRE